jgi:type II protein arginine methyltransferase
MVNDHVRNSAYRRAIVAAVDSFQTIYHRSPTVLDVGTGTGLLSLYAVEAGAAHVWTCEVNALLVNVAQQCVIANDANGMITIIHDHSTNLRLDRPLANGRPLPESGFDIIVTELVDAGNTKCCS